MKTQKDTKFKKKMIQLYLKGEPIKSICKKYAIKKSSLYSWIQQSKQGTRKNIHKEETKQWVIQLIEKGQSIKKISKRIKISESTIYYWVSKSSRLKEVKYSPTPIIDPYIIKLEQTNQILTLVSFIKDMSISEKYQSIRSLKNRFSITLLCKVFSLSRTTYYNHKNIKENTYELRDKLLKSTIMETYKRHKKRIGGEKIRHDLMLQGHTVSIKKVYQIMNDLNISKQVKKKNPYLKLSRNTNKNCKNILNQRFNPIAPNLVWVSDVTEVKINSKPVYLCIIMDLFARKVISHVVSRKNNTRLIVLTFNGALMYRNNSVTNMFHSDRGAQYTSYLFRALLRKYTITQSFSAPGYPYDNSPMESFFSQFKRETQSERNSIHTIKEYTALVNEYIDYYNEFRFHRGLGLLTPNKKEEMYYKSNF